MCLELTRWWNKIPRFTLFPKTVYKLGKKTNDYTFDSLYYIFEYVPGVTYNQKMVRDYNEISLGFHSFAHRSLVKTMINYFEEVVIGKFIIPAFTKYYVAYNYKKKLYVSSKIKFKGFITL